MTTVPGVQEVTSDEIPADSTERIQKVNAVMLQLTGAGLMTTPAMALAAGVAGATVPVAAQPGTAGVAQVASVAEGLLDAAMGVSAAAAAAGAAGAVPTAPMMPAPVPAVTAPAAVAADPKQVGGSPTATILVHNMFNKDEETEEGWDEDIRLDFEEESAKHGKIRSVVVMSKEPGGKLYAAFEAVDGARECAENLAGRWFDKRQLRVEFVADDAMPGQGK